MSGLVDKVVDGVKAVALEAEHQVEQLKTETELRKQNQQLTQGRSEKKEKKTKSSAEGDKKKHPLEVTPPPAFLQQRLALFDKLKAEQDAQAASQERKPITVTLPDGATKEAISWETSPMDIAVGISQGLADRTVIAKVNGKLWDMTRPFEEDATLELLDFSSPEGKRVFWHSSAHILGEAAERHYGCHLCLGPPTEEGFFYEMGMNSDRVVEAGDYNALETLAQNIVKEKQPFERLVLSKENLLEMFKYNKYKQYMISTKVPDGSSTTVYRCGPLIDLCVGPHVPHTGRIKSLAVMKNSASYFLGDAKNDSLQRIYGVSFPDKKQMAEHKAFLAEAAKRDHRRIGREQELFFFHELSPGSCFWLPHGARIYNTLVNFMKAEYRARGYEEVITPNMFNSKLWQTSGHWQNYSENMFSFDVEKEKFALKPMNCPGHCLLYKVRERSYRELPLRLADFGVLHRNEFSGALTGLTRVRRFQQDDAHIFCTPDQVKQEIMGVFDFLKHVYGVFGFTFKLELSTRPEKFLGKIETWNTAEAQLEEALNEFGVDWQLNPQDGAFYGPKIDVTISDALRRQFQCATIQLDFQLPQQFELEYASSTDEPNTRPVMIHRAILGSVERMTAILTEHYAGRWPVWLSPRQVMVIPIAPKYNAYAAKVRDELYAHGFHVDTDLSGNTIKKKVLNAQQDLYNFAFVVGADEEAEQSVNVRNCRDQGKQERAETIKLAEAIDRLKRVRDSKQQENEL
ncbi:threonyl-tRNA synthetase [Savitreella phatthalungensis]